MIDCSQECEVYTDTGTDVMGNHGRSRGIGRRGPEEKILALQLNTDSQETSHQKGIVVLTKRGVQECGKFN